MAQFATTKDCEKYPNYVRLLGKPKQGRVIPQFQLARAPRKSLLQTPRRQQTELADRL